MGSPDSVVRQYLATFFLPHPTSYFVGWNVCEATQGGLKEPKELQWPLQSPERHDAALGRVSAGKRAYQSHQPGQTCRGSPMDELFH